MKYWQIKEAVKQEDERRIPRKKLVQKISLGEYKTLFKRKNSFQKCKIDTNIVKYVK